MKRSKEDMRYKKSTAKIHAALLRLLETNHISDITIYALCAEAGITRGTFYRHYKSVSAVVTETEEELYQDYLHLVGIVPEDSYAPHKVLCGLMAIIGRNEPFFKMLFQRQDYRLMSRIFHSANPMIKKHWASVLRCKDKNLMNVLYYWSLYGVIGIMAEWVLERNCDKKLIDEYTQLACDLVSSGLSAYIKEKV